MKVFHGSYTAIEAVDLSKCQDNKDFGRGFYVTKFRTQAEEWAKIIGKAHGAAGVVTEFTFYERAFTENSLKSLRFSEYNEEHAADLFFSSTIFGQLAEKDTELYLKPWQEIYEILKTELKFSK